MRALENLGRGKEIDDRDRFASAQRRTRGCATIWLTAIRTTLSPVCRVQWSTVMAPRANWKGGSTEQLRRDIDSGRTGDKVDWPDPAMAAARWRLDLDFRSVRAPSGGPD
jgi:hypothetical protein